MLYPYLIIITFSSHDCIRYDAWCLVETNNLTQFNCKLFPPHSLTKSPPYILSLSRINVITIIIADDGAAFERDIHILSIQYINILPRPLSVCGHYPSSKIFGFVCFVINEVLLCYDLSVIILLIQ